MVHPAPGASPTRPCLTATGTKPHQDILTFQGNTCDLGWESRLGQWHPWAGCNLIMSHFSFRHKALLLTCSCTKTPKASPQGMSPTMSFKVWGLTPFTKSQFYCVSWEQPLARQVSPEVLSSPLPCSQPLLVDPSIEAPTLPTSQLLPCLCQRPPILLSLLDAGDALSQSVGFMLCSWPLLLPA